MKSRFLSALSNSIVNVYLSKIVGGEALSGASYQCSDARIKTNATLPGGNVPFDKENCIFNGTYINPEVKAIRTEIDNNLNPAIKEIYALLRNTIIAALAVLTIVAAFYFWHQRRCWRTISEMKAERVTRK